MTARPGQRARDLGLAPGGLPAGPANAITDVPGIRVGHATVIEGSDIRTGVTAIVHDTLLCSDPARRRTLPAGLAVFNGFGKMVGTTQVTELGTIETPVLLTSTLSVFRVADALLSYLHERPGNADIGHAEPGRRRDQRRLPVRHLGPADHRAARRGPRSTERPAARSPRAASAPAPAPARSATRPGSARRPGSATGSTGPVTLGVLVQANFGGELTVLGVPCPPRP